MMLTKQPKLETKPLVMAISLVSLSLITGNLMGCASQLTTTSNQSLYNTLLQANQNLTNRQSYAFDYRVKVVRSPESNLPKSTPISKTSRQKLVNQLIGQQQLSSNQQQLIASGVKYQSKADSNAEQYVAAFMKRFETSSSGVIDLGRGQFSVVPEFRYSQNNAGAFIRVPLAIDVVNAKFYADLSVLSDIATDPNYDGRYVVYDFGKYLDTKKLDKRGLLNTIRELTMLSPTLANESDYQRLPLTADDKQKGVTQRVGYHVSYNRMIAQYLLFLYLNEDHLKNLAKQIDFKDTKELKNIGEIAKSPSLSPTALMKKVFDGAILSTIDDKAYESAMRINEAIEEMRSEEGYSEESYSEESATATDETASTTAETTVVEDSENVESNDSTSTATDSETDTAKDDESIVSISQVLQQFDSFKSDKLVTSNQIADIIRQRPDAFANLENTIANQSAAILGKNSQINMSYGLNANNQLLNIVALTNIPSLGNAIGNSESPYQVQTVINFSDYGKARVNPAIFNNAITWKQASQNNNLLATSEQDKQFDLDKNLEALAYSLLKQNKGFIDTFTTLYTYQYLLQHDESTLQTIDMQALTDTAKNMAFQQAQAHSISVKTAEIPASEEKYEEEDSAQELGDMLSRAYYNQKYIQLAQNLTAKGMSQAQVFSQIYETLQDDGNPDGTPVASAIAAEAAATDAVEDNNSVTEEIADTVEQAACATLLDTEKLDKKSLNSLSKICDKIDKIAAEQYRDPSYATGDSTIMASAPTVVTAKQLAEEKRKTAKFKQLLGEIAVSDMQKQSHNISLADESNDELIKKLRPHFEASYGFDYDVYKRAYMILLLSK